MGIEAYYRPDRFMECDSVWANHLCLHARNLEGWRTLLRLSSKSWVTRKKGGGHYGKPCIDLDMLKHDHEGLVISTACVFGPLSQAILRGDDKGARKFIRDMKRLVGQYFWIELMPHDFDNQRQINIELVNLAYETDTQLIATGDVHIPYKDWKDSHLLMMMMATRQTFKSRVKKGNDGEEVYGDEIDTVYLSSGPEMFEMFQIHHPNLPEDVVLEAMGNTHDFARQFRFFVISKTPKPPRVKVNAEVEVRKWVDEGAEKKLLGYPRSHWKKWGKEVYRARREMEWEVLKGKGVLDYFYITGDFVRWAKSTLPLPKRDRHGKLYYPKGQRKRKIRVGLGRGSAAGCLISHDIGITAIDPIPHKLLFERFMNPDREGYPDIDIDFETGLIVLTTDDGRELDGREAVKEYLRIKWGHDHVADIIAYQTFAPRACINSVGTAYDINYQRLKDATESIGDTERGLERIANGVPDKDVAPNEIVAKLRDDFPEAWKHMLRFEDQIKGDSRHAGGVVITPGPINRFIPTQTEADEETLITAWADRADFPIMADFGFLKYDILGVVSLAKQELATQLIRKHYGVDFEPNEMPVLRDPYDVDQSVIDLFVNGLTVGIFQFGGGGITKLLKHIRPDNATDISVANALFRPGPIQIAFEYGDRKQGKTPITYWHDSLEPILGETLGLMCFQEQAMEVSKQIGNFTGGQADALRKAMSKLYRLPGDKAQEFMAQFKEQWHHGCHENGLRERDAEFIWTDRMLPLGNYLFNRSHSSSYGLQAIQDGHLKQHYPLAFYASLLTVEKKSKRIEQEKFLRSAIREAGIFDIQAGGPDINTSDVGWTISDGKIRYGLSSISGIGRQAAEQIIEHGPFEDLRAFIEQMPSGFGVDGAVALAQAGAFDGLESREELLSRAAQWGDNVAKYKIKMTCGHLKSKTVKAKDGEDLEKLAKDALYEIECKHHPDAEIKESTLLDNTYEMVRWVKDHPEDDLPEPMWTPGEEDLLSMEKDVLIAPISQTTLALDYKDFIERYIFTEAEFNDIKGRSTKRDTRHRMYCNCKTCQASLVTVAGEVVQSKSIVTKGKKETMGFFDLAYGMNRYSCTMFPENWRRFHKLLDAGVPVIVNGYKDDRDKIVVFEVEDILSLAKAKGWSPNGNGALKRLRHKAVAVAR